MNLAAVFQRLVRKDDEGNEEEEQNFDDPLETELATDPDFADLPPDEQQRTLSIPTNQEFKFEYWLFSNLFLHSKILFKRHLLCNFV